MTEISVYVRTGSGKKIVCLQSNRDSLRCRQRSRSSDGLKYATLKFVSYKEMQKELKKSNLKKVVGPYHFNTISRL